MNLHKLIPRMTAAAVASAMALSLCAPALAAAPPLPALAADAALLSQENDDAATTNNVFDISNGSITVTVQNDGSQTVEQGGSSTTVASGAQVEIEEGNSGGWNTITVKRAEGTTTGTARITFRNVEAGASQLIMDNCPVELTLEGIYNSLYVNDRKKYQIDGTGAESKLTIKGTGGSEDGDRLGIGNPGKGIRCAAVILDENLDGGIVIDSGDITADCVEIRGGSLKTAKITATNGVTVSGSAMVMASSMSNGTVSGNAKVYLTAQSDVSNITTNFTDEDTGWLLYRDDKNIVHSARLGYTVSENIDNGSLYPENYGRVELQKNPTSFDINSGSITVTVNDAKSQTVEQNGKSYDYSVDTSVEINGGPTYTNGVTVKRATRATGTANITFNNLKMPRLTMENCPVELTLKGEENELSYNQPTDLYDIGGTGDASALTIKGGGTLEITSHGNGINCAAVTLADTFTGTLAVNTGDITATNGGVEILGGTLNAAHSINAATSVTVRGSAKVRAASISATNSCYATDNAKVYLTGQSDVSNIDTTKLATDGTGWLLYNDNGTVHSARLGYTVPENFNGNSLELKDFEKVQLEKNPTSFSINNGNITVVVSNTAQTVQQNGRNYPYPADTSVEINGGPAYNNSVTAKRATGATSTAKLTFNGMEAACLTMENCPVKLTLEGTNILNFGDNNVNYNNEQNIKGSGWESALTIKGSGTLNMNGRGNGVSCAAVTLADTFTGTLAVNTGDITATNGSVEILGGTLNAAHSINAETGVTVSGSAKVRAVSINKGTIKGNAKVYLTGQNDVSNITADFADTDTGWLLYKDDNDVVHSAKAGYAAPAGIENAEPSNYDSISLTKNPDRIDLQNGAITVTANTDGSQTVTQNSRSYTYEKDKEVVITSNGIETANNIVVGQYSDIANITLRDVNIVTTEDYALREKGGLLNLTLDGENTLKGSARGIYSSGDLRIRAKTDNSDKLTVNGIQGLYVNIQSGTLNVSNGNDDKAIVSNNTMTITGGVVTINGKVDLEDGSVCIENASVKADNLTLHSIQSVTIRGNARVYLTSQSDAGRFDTTGLTTGWLLYKDADDKVCGAPVGYVAPENIDQMDPADYKPLEANPESIDIGNGSITVTVNTDGSQTVVQGDKNYVYEKNKEVVITGTAKDLSLSAVTVEDGTNTNPAKITLKDVYAVTTHNHALIVLGSLNLTLEGANTLQSRWLGIGGNGDLTIQANSNADKLTVNGIGGNNVAIEGGTVNADGDIGAHGTVTIENANVKANTMNKGTVSGNAKVYLTSQNDVSGINTEGLTTGWLLYKDTDGKVCGAPVGYAAPTETELADPANYDSIVFNANPASFDIADGSIAVTVNDTTQTVEQNGKSYVYPSDAQIVITGNGTETKNAISVTGTGTANITLSGVNINTVADEYALKVGALNTILTLDGENILSSAGGGIGYGYAVPSGTGVNVTIKAKTDNTTDKLTVRGGSKIGIDAGELTIESGTVEAFGRNGALRAKNDLTISGGIVNADGSIKADSGTVTIENASVKADTLPDGTTIGGTAKVYLTSQTDVSGINTDALAANGTGWLIYKDATGTLQGVPEGYDAPSFDPDAPDSYKDLTAKKDPGEDKPGGGEDKPGGGDNPGSGDNPGEDDPGTDVPGTGDVGGGDGGAGAAVAVAVGGAAAVVGGYEIATRVILSDLLPEGAAIPANRGQLAVLVWNAAGRPEPAGTAAFTDVADADMAKAAQWCIEQGLLEAKQDGRFEPNGWTPKFRVIEVWNKAFPKG